MSALCKLLWLVEAAEETLLRLLHPPARQWVCGLNPTPHRPVPQHPDERCRKGQRYYLSSSRQIYSCA
jgi:hypothetical protein